jgi:hypothetical protein
MFKRRSDASHRRAVDALSTEGRALRPSRGTSVLLEVLAVALAVVFCAAVAPLAVAGTERSSTSTVWLCRPGMADDPCTSSLATTVISASGKTSVSSSTPKTPARFACFYAYGTVSRETSPNADLRVQKAEIDSAIAQGSPFSPLCQVYAPIYRQVTLADLISHPDLNFGPAESVTAYDSIRSGFEEFLASDLDNRPFIVIGDSQGAAMLNLLLEHFVDNSPALRSKLVVAIILGGNVEVPSGKLVGGTFAHIPACNRAGETGCLIAYSSFPSEPPADSLFARPGQGVSLQSGQTAKKGLQVVCVNPAALSSGGPATLDSIFPSLGVVSTPWVAYPGLYTSRCEQKDGASWLDVSKATGRSDHRPTVSEEDGPLFGYHVWDLSLAQGNLVNDVAASESTWMKANR